MSQKSNEITGLFMSFSSEEIAEINRKLELFQYEQGGTGLKEWILDNLLCEDDETVNEDKRTNRIIDMLQEDPQKIIDGVSGIAKLCSGIIQNINKKPR